MRALRKTNARTGVWMLSVLVALLGLAVVVAGAVGQRIHLVFGGAMFCIFAALTVWHERAVRPGRDGSPAANAEKAAWSQIGMGASAFMVLGGMSLNPGRGAWADYLLFFAFALIVVFFPAFRRRYIEEGRRYREVAEDERDRVIRAQGDALSKRLLELALVALAIAWLLAPGLIRSVREPLQVAALLLLPALAANMAGDARVALLHWRDRQ